MLVDRYLIREVSLPFIGLTVALLAVFLAYSTTAFLAKASSGLLNPGEILPLIALKSAIALEVLVPLALYLGIIMGLGRLYNDSEMYALQAAGIGESRLLRPILIYATTMAIVVSLLSTVVRPLAYEAIYDITASAASTSELERIKAGQFYVDRDSGRAVFIQGMSDDRRDLQGVFVRTRDAHGLQVASAAAGYLEPIATAGMHRLILLDAQVYKLVSNAPDVLGRFKRLTVYLNVPDPELVGYRVKAQSTWDLHSSKEAEEQAEFEWRLSATVSVLLLVLAAVPLSRSLPRRGRFAKIMIALLVYAVYLNLVVMARTWVAQQVVGTLMWVPALLAVFVVFLYRPQR